MAQGIEIFYWALSILFCLAFGFAILMWARGWRREEREESTRRMSELAAQVTKLSSAVEQLEHTAASLQTADELLAQGIKDLRAVPRQTKPAPPKAEPVAPPTPVQVKPAPAPPVASPTATADESADDDRFAAARKMLLEGRSPTEVAQKLDIGAAEAKMLARVVEREQSTGDAG
jgi:hypothetical protein